MQSFHPGRGKLSQPRFYQKGAAKGEAVGLRHGNLARQDSLDGHARTGDLAAGDQVRDIDSGMWIV